jgi:hypothetical protein
MKPGRRAGSAQKAMMIDLFDPNLLLVVVILMITRGTQIGR